MTSRRGKRTLTGIVVVALIAAAAYLVYRNQPGRTSASPATMRTADVDESAQAGAASTLTRNAQEQRATLDTTADECLSAREIAEHPGLLQDARRFHSVITNGREIADFRGVGGEALRDFALQGNSAAMAILGARAVMRAFGEQEEQAIRWLNFKRTDLNTRLASKTVSDSAIPALREAADWFYQAALHGRLYALVNYGELLGAISGGPVGLGWIDQEEFTALNSKERSALLPGNLYHSVANDIAPQLRDGTYGVLMTMIPETERQRRLRLPLVESYRRDRANAGLPPLDVAGTASPSLDELLSQVCERERLELERRYRMQDALRHNH